MVAFGIFFLILLFITIDYMVHKKELEIEAKGPLATKLRRTLRKDLIISHMPEGLFFSPGHLWVELCRNGDLKIGITELPLFAMGSDSRLEVRNDQKNIHKNENFITLYNEELSVKFKAPFNLEVLEINKVEDRMIVLDPYRDGWLLRVRAPEFASNLHSLYLGQNASVWMSEEIDNLQTYLSAHPEEHKSNEEVKNLYDGFFRHLESDYFKAVSNWITDPATR